MLTTRYFAAATLALAGGLAAQSPLAATFSSNNGADGVMFDVRSIVPITIDNFDVNLDAGTWDIEIYTTVGGGSHRGLEQDPLGWTLVASAADITSAGADQATSLPFTSSLNVRVECGEQRGFYITATGGAPLNYTVETGVVVGDIQAQNDHLQLLAGVGVDYLHSTVYGLPLSSRQFNGNIHYTPTLNVICGDSADLGGGCQTESASAYEVHEALLMDLAGTTLTAINNGDGFDVTKSTSNIAPLGPNAVNCNLGDDDSVDTATLGGTLGIHVGSNGWVALGPGNSTFYEPDVGTMLNNPSTAIYAWTDLQPASAGGLNGDIWYEETGSVATVTFDGVDGWGTGQRNTIQFTWDVANNNWSIAFGNLSLNNPEQWVVGYSPSTSNFDNGPTDLSFGGFFLAALDYAGLTLESTRPVIGSTWTLQSSNLVNALGSAFMIGSIPLGEHGEGISLAGVGAPKCKAFTLGDLGTVFGVGFGGTASFPIPVPNNPALMGSTVVAQAFSKQPVNAFGWTSSNGIQATVGF